MARQKHSQTGYWITPGVFRGSFEVEHAVGQTAFVKKMPEEETTQEERIRRMEEQLQQVCSELERYQQEWEQFQEEMEKEREHLYQVVLSLKKEWESRRER
ncbi:MAG: hypothetical protein H0Z34_04410 [Brevibacillus sp.]|nr:hypothetical protein [Brevibacillus sp.]